MENGTILVIATLLLAAFWAYGMVARETGFRIINPTQDGKSRFAIPTWIKGISLTPDKDFSSRSLWVCIVVGAIGFHWYHTIYPLFTCMIIRSFFLPTTTFSVAARWVYIFVMIAFYYLPGIETYSAAKVDDLKTATKQMGEDAKNHKPPAVVIQQQSPTPTASQHAGQNAPPPIALTAEWSSPVFLPPGKIVTFYCTEKGAEMAMLYSSGEKTTAASGKAVPCPTADEFAPRNGVNVMNARYIFRSQKPWVVALVFW